MAFGRLRNELVCFRYTTERLGEGLIWRRRAEMKKIERDLQGLLEGLKALTAQIDSLIERCDKLTRGEGAGNREAKSKPTGSPR